MEQRELHINGLLHNMEVTMSNFTIKDMLAMQQALQEKYKDKWEAISPEAGKHNLLCPIHKTKKAKGNEILLPYTY